MLVEYRRKSHKESNSLFTNSRYDESYTVIYDWAPVPLEWKAEEISFEQYSIRINKDRQYHREGTKGFVDAFNKSMLWMQLNR